MKFLFLFLDKKSRIKVFFEEWFDLVCSIVLVPDRRCRIHLEVVPVRRWVNWGSGNLEGGGFGERVGTGEVSLQAT
jgi:hypothetical protein